MFPTFSCFVLPFFIHRSSVRLDQIHEGDSGYYEKQRKLFREGLTINGSLLEKQTVLSRVQFKHNIVKTEVTKMEGELR